MHRVFSGFRSVPAKLELLRALIVGLFLLAGAANAQELSRNGFILDGALVSPSEIQSGGVTRDVIPAIVEPKFVMAAEADFLREDDRVLGVDFAGQTRAYPVKILNYHEIVNDNFNGTPMVISWCPLCGSGIVFAALINNEAHTFGVSGLLFNSDLLMYDHQTESLWSQFVGLAITGPMKGMRLVTVPASNTTWGAWLELYPDSLVLSDEQGYNQFNYGRNAYASYEINREIRFPIRQISRKFSPKASILGVEINQQFKAYPFKKLPKNKNRIEDEFAGQKLVIEYDRDLKAGRVLNEAGEEIPSFISYWFAWYSFHPNTEIYPK